MGSFQGGVSQHEISKVKTGSSCGMFEGCDLATHFSGEGVG